jgi:perosamine synthetase
MKVPLCTPYFGEEELRAVKDVLDSGWLAHGPKVKEFEKDFADYIGVKHAISVNSCASALQLAIQADQIKDEIILPSFTFSASANAVVTAGAKPVFADIEYESCNISPEDIKKRVTSKTRAIMPVYFAGQPCQMDEIMEIAEKHNLRIIEDSAECIGGLFNNKMAGSFGTGCFSFYPTKNITTGEGGMITLNDDDSAGKIRTLKAHGISSTAHQRENQEKPWLREAIMPGYNYRMCDILAAIGIWQLKKVDKMNELRIKHALYLNKKLSQINGIEPPVKSKGCKHVYQMYTIKLKDIDRTSFIKYLRDNEIGANVHFDPPVHEQMFYKGFGKDLPVTEDVSQRIVTLPMFPQLSQEQLDFVLEKIDAAAKKFRIS